MPDAHAWNKRYKLKILKAHAPTSTHNNEEVKQVSGDVEEGLKNRKFIFQIMEDFNAQ